MQNETRITIYTAISLILAALTLGLLIFGLTTRSSFASARENEKSGRERAAMNMRYAKYNGEEISGAEVVAMIRDNYTEDIDIYVDLDKNNNKWCKSRLTGFYWVGTVGTTPSMLAKYNNYAFDYHVLSSLFNATDKYTAYLVYDSNNIEDYSKRGVRTEYSWVTGVQVIKK